ncbi:MAG TPA: hypothetical protein VL860_14975, partial [Planctomycetota bacterium]|nr:hypothetical protein [Planctomycetota bacterium]
MPRCLHNFVPFLAVGLGLQLLSVAAGDATQPPTPPPAQGTPSGDSLAPPMQPQYAAFPGIWFDYLPDVVSTETGWELKFRVGVSSARSVGVEFLGADHQPLPTPSAQAGTATVGPAKIAITTTAEDRAHGHFQVLSLAVPAEPKIRFIRLTTQPTNGSVQVSVEVRDSSVQMADLTLAALPPASRIGTAENL